MLTGTRQIVSSHIKLVFILISISIVYWHEFFLVFNEAWTNEYFNYVFAVPLLILYLLYRSRRSVLATISLQSRDEMWVYLPLNELLGVSLCSFAILMKMFASYLFDPLGYQLLSLPIFVVGIILILFDFSVVKVLWVPIAFLIFFVPPPFLAIQQIGVFLSYYSGQASYLILRFLGINAEWLLEYGSPVINVVKPNGSELLFSLDVACSGIYSMLGFIVFAFFISAISIGPVWKKAFLVALGFPLLHLLNVLRVTTLVLIGYFFDTGLVLSAFHTTSGLVLVGLGIFALVVVADRIIKLSFFPSINDVCNSDHGHGLRDYCSECGKVLRIQHKVLTGVDYAKLGLILTGVIFINSLYVPTFVLTRSNEDFFIEQSLGQNNILSVLPQIEEYNLRFIYRDEDFEKQSGQDATLMYMYDNPAAKKNTYFVSFEIASSKGKLHLWEVCLITHPLEVRQAPLVEKVDLRDIHLIDDPPLSARYFAYKPNIRSNNTQVVLYWYTESVYRTEQGYERKWAKISVISSASSPAESISVEKAMLPIAEKISRYHQPVTSWSWVALLVGTHGVTILIFNSVVIIGLIIILFYKRYRLGANVANVFRNITNAEDRLLLEQIKNAKTGVIEGNLLIKYRELIGKDIDQYVLYDKLQNAVKLGLIKHEIINVNNQPYIKWKSNFN